MLSVGIKPGSEAGGLNVRSRLHPGDLLDFRTCEGVVTGSRDFGLFQVKLPAEPGNGDRSWLIDGDKWSYTWTYAAGVRVRVEVVQAEECLKLAYTLTNVGSVALDAVQVHTCIPTTEAPGFRPDPTGQGADRTWSELYHRLYVCSEGRRLPFGAARLSRGEQHLALCRRGGPTTHWGWWVNGSETFDLPIVALTSRDRSHTVALAFEQAAWASANVGDDRACFHLFPWFGRIEPGAAVTVRGHLYVLEGGPDAAFERFERDYPSLVSRAIGPRWVDLRSAYSPGPSRYRFGEPDVRNPAYYPIPQDRVTRTTYMRWIEGSGLLECAKKPAMGMSGPQSFMPVLAKYVETGNRRLGRAIITMLKDFHRALREEVARKGWFWQFIEEPAFIPLYRKHLMAGGMLKPDEPWFREMWLYYCRNLHVWDTEPVEWRGGCHRSMPEALAKGLAAKWYPDIAEAAHWRRYAELGFQDFWRAKDLAQNDTGYLVGPVLMLLCAGDQYLGDDRAVTDPGMLKLWRRFAAEVTPDGAINPYGPNGGWNSTAAFRVFMLELVAARTRDGELRFAAHRAMNYLRYQTPAYEGDGYLTGRETGQHVALAWLFADDRVAPRTPRAASELTDRLPSFRIPHTDKAIAGRYLPDLDPDPLRAHVCCSWVFGAEPVPDKLILRGGWGPGDLFGLVELCPTSFPANPGGIMGLTRWGAPFTQIASTKGGSVENRVLLEDLSGQAPRRYVKDRTFFGEDWKQGSLPAQTSRVDHFCDTAQATFARVSVGSFLGLPVRFEREFILIKDLCLVSRETVVFEEAFPAIVGPTWNTQNIGPQVGAHWANTYMTAPIASNGAVALRTPPADLLVWFAPRPDCRLQVIDRRDDDPRTEVAPYQMRYVWEGRPVAGRRLTWTEVYWPHRPWKPRPSTNNPGATPVYDEGRIAESAGASAIEVLIDTSDTTVLRLHLSEECTEWVVANPKRNEVDIDGLRTDARYAVVRAPISGRATASVMDASRLSLAGEELLTPNPIR